MSITLHYKGSLNEQKDVGKLRDQLTDFAQTLGWRHEDWNESRPNHRGNPLLMKEDGSGLDGRWPLRGITLYPHEDCEPLFLTFGPDGSLIHPRRLLLAESESREERWLSTKTQFAPIEVHTGIIKLLQHLKKRYISDLEVHDEGGYWESGDIHQLKQRLDSITHALDVLGNALREDQPLLGRGSSPEELAGMIEKIFRGKFGDGNG
jgi:hypothetical protein